MMQFISGQFNLDFYYKLIIIGFIWLRNSHSVSNFITKQVYVF